MKTVRTTPRERLQQKVDLLRRWAAVGVPPDKREGLPTSITKFAAWVDGDLGLESIASPNAVSSKGPHGDLIREAGDLIKTFRVPKRRAESKSERDARRDTKLAEHGDRIRELTGAWHMARELAVQLETECASYKTRISDLEVENAQLRKQIGQIVPLCLEKKL